jgi:hypothetical protein
MNMNVNDVRIRYFECWVLTRSKIDQIPVQMRQFITQGIRNDVNLKNIREDTDWIWNCIVMEGLRRNWRLGDFERKKIKNK